MSTVLCYIGVVLAVVLVTVGTYKGGNVLVMTLIGSIVLCLFSGLPIAATLAEGYAQGAAGMFGKMLLMFIVGCVLGRIYTDTGAGDSVASLFTKLILDRFPESKKKLGAIVTVTVIAVIMGFGGLDSYVVMFTMFPICLSLVERVNIPRRLVAGIGLGPIGVTYAAPGSAQAGNIIPALHLETGPYSGLVGGIAGILVIFVGVIINSYRFALKAEKKGESFEYGRLAAATKHESDNRPNEIASLIPLVVIFVVYNLLSQPIWIALGCGLVIALILFGKYLPKDEGQNFIQAAMASAGTGLQRGMMALVILSAVTGYGSVICMSPVFDNIMNFLLKVPGPALLAYTIIVILIGVLANSPAIMYRAMDLFSPVVGSLEQMHRVSAFASQCLNSLPATGSVVTALELSDTTQEDGYTLIFFNTVIVTTLGALVCAVIYSIFPWLP